MLKLAAPEGSTAMIRPCSIATLPSMTRLAPSSVMIVASLISNLPAIRFHSLTLGIVSATRQKKEGRSPFDLNNVSLQSAWRWRLARQSINRIGLPFLQVGIEKIPVHESVIALRFEQVEDQRRGRLRGSNQNRAGRELNCLFLGTAFELDLGVALKSARGLLHVIDYEAFDFDV